MSSISYKIVWKERNRWGYRSNQIGDKLTIFEAGDEYTGVCYIILLQEDGAEVVQSRN